MKRIAFIWILLLSIVLVAGESRAVIFGTLMGTPDEGKVTYVATSDDFAHILTEDGFNSAQGTDQGYQGGYWVLEAGNLEPVPQIEVTTIKIEFAGIDTEAGKFGGDPFTFSDPNEDRREISFPAADNPATPPLPALEVISAGEVQLTWANAQGVTYDVYRSTQVSGANNEASNGRYQRIAVDVTSPYTDNNAPANTGDLAWYLLIAKAAGKRSGHSPEVKNTESAGPTNNPPVWKDIPAEKLSFNENETLTLNLAEYAKDEDTDDKLTFAVKGELPDGATVTGGTFAWTPSYEQAGEYIVTFTVTDGKVETPIEKEVKITVKNVNREPVLDSIGAMSIQAGEELSFTVTAKDDDKDDTLKFSAENLPGDSHLDEDTGEFTWTPKAEDALDTPYKVVFKVDDQKGGIDSEEVEITVTEVEPPAEFPRWDVNEDGVVDILDLVLVGKHFGEDYRTIPAMATLSEMGVPSNKNATVRIEVQNQVSLEGARFLQIDINTTSVFSLYGCQFDLVFDAKVLEVAGVKAGGVLAKDGAFTYWNASEIDNQRGRIGNVTYVRKATKEGIDASGTLATVIFEVKDISISGTTRLNLTNITLADVDARLIHVVTESTLLNWEELLVPEKTMLLPNYPNPFNPETWLPYQLRKGSEVTIRIYSVSGDQVREIALGHKPAGLYISRDRAAHWDGQNQLGRVVASGVYFYSIKAGYFVATRKMVIVK